MLCEAVYKAALSKLKKLKSVIPRWCWEMLLDVLDAETLIKISFVSVVQECLGSIIDSSEKLHFEFKVGDSFAEMKVFNYVELTINEDKKDIIVKDFKRGEALHRLDKYYETYRELLQRIEKLMQTKFDVSEKDVFEPADLL